MGLGDFQTSESDEDNSNSSSKSSSSKKRKKSSSSSGSSDSEEFPKYKRIVPEAVIRKTDDGTYEGIRYPNTPEVRMTKEWHTVPYELDYDNEPLPEWENWQRYWLTKEQWQRSRRMVKEVLNLDINRLLKEEPEKLLRAVKEAAQKYDIDTSKPSSARACGICDKRLNPITDDCREINHTLVCERHSVEDLHHAGLLK